MAYYCKILYYDGHYKVVYYCKILYYDGHYKVAYYFKILYYDGHYKVAYYCKILYYDGHYKVAYYCKILYYDSHYKVAYYCKILSFLAHLSERRTCVSSVRRPSYIVCQHFQTSSLKPVANSKQISNGDSLGWRNESLHKYSMVILPKMANTTMKDKKKNFKNVHLCNKRTKWPWVALWIWT